MATAVKAIYALCDEATVTRALRPDFRRDLAGAGAVRVQVNVDDTDVADAQLRTVNGSSPVRTVLSVWSDGDPAAVTEVVRDLDPAAAGWLVRDRQPIRPPQVPDGERADALANFALLRKPEGLSRGEWLRRWIGRHTRAAIDTQATFGYVQNVVTERLTDDLRDVAGLVEELFPMAAMTDWHAHYGSGGDVDELKRRVAVLRQSCARFGAGDGIDVVPTSRYIFDLG